MTFTIVFKGIHVNLSYMLCFEPCPIWRRQGSDWTIVPNRHNPHYEIGRQSEKIAESRKRSNP